MSAGKRAHLAGLEQPRQVVETIPGALPAPWPDPSSIQPPAEPLLTFPPRSGPLSCHSPQPGSLQSLWLVLVQLQNTVSSRLETLEGHISYLKLRSVTQERRIAANCKRLDALERNVPHLCTQVPVKSEDVAVSFSQDEWGYLDEGQKENYETLISLESGLQRIHPDILSKMKEAEEPYLQDPQGADKTELVQSYTAGNEIVNKEEREENQECSERVGLISRQSGAVSMNISQWSERGGRSQSLQEAEKKQRDCTENILDGAICCEKSNRELADISEHQTQVGRHFQNSSSDHIPSDFYPRAQKGKKTNLCETCGKSFNRKYCLWMHQRTHTVQRPFPCSQCGRCFKEKLILNIHQRIHTQRLSFTCSECKKSFVRKDSLVIHRKLHTNNRSFHCPEDGASYNSKFSLKKHQKMQAKESVFSNPERKEIIIQEQDLPFHQNEEIKENLFSCTVCDKSFIYLWQLKKHQKIHMKEKQYKCTECDRSFIYLSNLKRHQIIHTGQKPFICSECNKTFTRLSSLKMHQNIHIGVKPFLCTECNKCFTSGSYLKMHQKIHVGEKPFICTECDKTFNQKSYLRKHLKIHSGEKPFRCTECDKCFANVSQLKMHLRIHMGKKRFNCGECDKSFVKKSDFTCHLQIHKEENLDVLGVV